MEPRGATSLVSRSDRVVGELDRLGKGPRVVVDDLPAAAAAELEHRPGAVRHPGQHLAVRRRHAEEREQAGAQRRAMPDDDSRSPPRRRPSAASFSTATIRSHTCSIDSAPRTPGFRPAMKCRVDLRVLLLELGEGQPLAQPHVELAQPLVETELERGQQLDRAPRPSPGRAPGRSTRRRPAGTTRGTALPEPPRRARPRPARRSRVPGRGRPRSTRCGRGARSTSRRVPG